VGQSRCRAGGGWTPQGGGGRAKAKKKKGPAETLSKKFQKIRGRRNPATGLDCRKFLPRTKQTKLGRGETWAPGGRVGKLREKVPTGGGTKGGPPRGAAGGQKGGKIFPPANGTKTKKQGAKDKGSKKMGAPREEGGGPGARPEKTHLLGGLVFRKGGGRGHPRVGIGWGVFHQQKPKTPAGKKKKKFLVNPRGGRGGGGGNRIARLNNVRGERGGGAQIGLHGAPGHS